MADETSSTQDDQNVAPQPEFKKPVLIGKIGKLPKKAKINPEKAPEESTEEKTREIQINIQTSKDSVSKSSLPPAMLLKELSTPIPYKEPKWSGICPDGSGYALEVLKSGCILERIDLTTKSYYVFGRLANCDVVMAHPTISRHHAVLQYKAVVQDVTEPPAGWYMYELGSTHGTQLNRGALRAAHYTRVRVGHHIKFGNSTRTYVLLGPEWDSEGESELSVSEIKARAEVMRAARERELREAADLRTRSREQEERQLEERGIDWGMGEDAEEEPDLSDNPYAATSNEELFLQDPKKTLRGYFEREGHELTYQCDERAKGQYICRVELPLDDARGRPVVAEAVHSGKKKEAVVACALEACRLLDRAGLLRQAHHESRAARGRVERRAAEEYYDSDDDTFLDRTGSVERKRARRKNHEKQQEKALSHDDLVKQIEELETKISTEERTLERLRGASARDAAAGEVDDLDAYMERLAKAPTVAHKADISKTKSGLVTLRAELARARRLAELARPNVAPLCPAPAAPAAPGLPLRLHQAVLYGKRIKLKDDDKKPKPKPTAKKEDDEFVEEVDSDEEMPDTSRSKNENDVKQTESKTEDDRKEDLNDLNRHTENEKDLKQNTSKSETEIEKSQSATETAKKVYGPMRPPDDYMIPEDYFEQTSNRDLPEVTEEE